MDGYDPVAYFTQEKAVEGRSDHSLTWDGVVWYFASAEHRRMFEQSPETYVPKYGGYDAYMMSQNTKMRVDQEDFLIADGALYLFKNRSLMRMFEEDMRRKIAYANHYWNKQ